MSQRCFIGLGSNLDHPREQIRRASQVLAQMPETSLVKISGLYQSKPMGPQDQPDYMNAVAEIETELSPAALLQALQDIEQQLGRRRLRHWGERTIDLDILLYGDQQIKQADLLVPHPGIPEREFVLYPLQEIAPDLEIPSMGHITTLIAACAADSIEYLGTIDG